ncbi:MAG: acetyl-CoA carboxylase biotin carboxylase subunit [Candidatus Acididesulfobacter diazotrophicus]|jgi:pyruvate carboxylase subunit A|uniref:Acetyl-CoA carboxylase biotin carboxylase subunit n=1 Tax=Candidatus Acididesulfobacter diazotrophicus TaxID=2597226 RepID=A0A519BLR4_9DELT|nr:MAG: acetyl-CoA carboxylase biotin carboxylase subunit [Candidatus Acididesulfobacter diazotrophicus]
MKKFNKVLIANRGEIASRIIRACKELGIKTVAIYSEADSQALHVKKADEAYLVGPGPISGYLNVNRIVDLAVNVGVDAIHPGYGFLSENAKFPAYCEKRGIVFIGPSAKSIAMMGDKIESKKLMRKAGVPVVEGSEGGVISEEDALSIAHFIGYPVMIKASAGGGGKGIRICFNDEDIKKNFSLSRSEAEKSFGNPEVFIEKYIDKPHHIEFQILADNYGNIIHLGERDCSIQRKHQKLIEIAPSLILTEELRKRMGESAIAAAKACDYRNAGTIEYIMDKNGNYYFMEMNTRIQVEHPVTEMVTGVDIVGEQIQIAMGKELDIKQEDVVLRGYAIECRINAENPRKDFAPSTGKITAYYSPGGIGVRIDGSVYKDYILPPFYDSMIAKMTVYGRTWDETVRRASRALQEFVIKGIRTTIPFQLKIIEDEDFIKGNFDTHFIEERQYLRDYKIQRDPSDRIIAISAAIAAYYGI